jgi:gliding motility-associated-like protein
LQGGECSVGLPVYPNYRLGKLKPPAAYAGPDTTICPGDSVQLGHAPVHPFRYRWQPAGGLSCTTCAQPLASPDTTTAYVLEATTDCGPHYDTVTVRVKDSVPRLAPLASDTTICPGDTLPVGQPAVAGWQYQWQPAEAVSNDSAAQPQASPRVTTSLRRLAHHECGRRDTSQRKLRLAPISAAFALRDTTRLTTGEPFRLVNQSEGARQYLWQLGDGRTREAADPSPLSYPEPGRYRITLTAENERGCQDTAQHTLRVRPAAHVQVPNVFSPNGDGVNDVFQPEVQHIGGYRLVITDRWGRQHFQSDAPQEGWPAREAPEGVYFYTLRYQTLEGDWQTRTGTVTLVR